MSSEEMRKQQLQQMASQCSSYGLKAGTQQFSQCMIQLDRQSRLEDVCRDVALQAPFGEGAKAKADCLAGRPVSRQAPRTPTNTSCTRAGNTINCTTN
jgi:hypothetical protein